MTEREELERMEETCTSSELIFDGRVIRLFKDEIRLPDGRPAMREYMRHIGAVCVLPLFADGTVACVRQYRYPQAEVLTEIPAGKLDCRDEDRAEAALRELREETGCRCRKLTHLGKIYTSPAILDEVIDMYLAEDLEEGETDFDDDEFLAPVRIPLATLVDMVMAGEIPDGKTQAAVMRVNELLRRRAESVASDADQG